MLFNSYLFFGFFLITLTVYFVVPAKVRTLWLLLCSYFFYMCWKPIYILLILLTTVITYCCGLLMKSFGKRRWILAVGIITNFAILFYFKYFTFFVSIFIKDYKMPYEVLLPVGISFYTFQAVGYTIDVYKGKMSEETNFLYYSLYISFFPQLVAGPIERADRLLGQLHSIESKTRKELLDYDRIKKGIFLIAWGYFIKMVIADRLSGIADAAYSNVDGSGRIMLIIGVFAFAIQIYCDFCSYSIIAIGCANIIGVQLMDNFDTPYFAIDIKDFWRRWHISLSTWFRDYLYIPLGGNRCSKFRKYINLIITFLVSGLWHGANWTFIAWGGIHGLYQILEELCKPLKRLTDKFFNGRYSVVFRLLCYVKTFVLVSFAWIFFRSTSIGDAIHYIVRIFTARDIENFAEELQMIGLDRIEILILTVAIILLLVVDIIRKKTGKRIDEFMMDQKGLLQWFYVYLIVMIIVIFGVYGLSEEMKSFIYFQF